MRPVRLRFVCAECGGEITVTITPPVRASAWDAPEGSQIDEVTGCPHAGSLAESWQFLGEALTAAADETIDAYDREMEARVDRLRDRWVE